MAALGQGALSTGRDPSPETQSEPDSIDAFGGLRVADLLAEGRAGSASLPHETPLQGAAGALASAGQSALAVAAAQGGLAGIFTENDIVRAYFEGAPPDLSVDAWLGSGMARASAEQLRQVVVRPEDPLASVAVRMVGNLLSGDCACHHVVVQAEDGRLQGVLSSLDLIHALRRAGSDAHPASVLQEGKGAADVDCSSKIDESTVWDVMKRRNDIFTCPPSSDIKDVLKVMLLSGQNSVLIVDDHGVHGVITPRDILRAFADGVRVGSPIADLGPSVVDRVIQSHERLARALAVMGERGVGHLVVVRSRTPEVVGLLSSLDVLLSTRAQTRRAYCLHGAVGAPVGELVASHRHFTAACSTEETLSSAAALLMSSGRTAAVVRTPGGTPLGLLTENDFARALREGVPRGTRIQDWYWEREAACQGLHPHLVIRPSVRVTEAATLMTLMQSAADGGRGPCHHLVVQGADGEWLGLFSALDVARGVSGLRTELEVSRTGADHARVAEAMKRSVPRCAPSDSLDAALGALEDSRQNCVLVEDEEGLRGVITPRCAVQAFALGTPRDACTAECLSSADYRLVEPDAQLVDAAAMMTTHGLHHLVVRAPGGGKALGVLSSLDVVRGVASISSQCPFVSLRWLGLCRGRECCMIRGA